MELSRLFVSDTCFFSPPIRHSPSPALTSFLAVNLRINRRRRRSFYSDSNNDTLIAGGGPAVAGAGEKHEEDLKSWMHKQGLPPCKVVLKDKPCHNDPHKPIHYVAASEDLQVHSPLKNNFIIVIIAAVVVWIVS